ncbi:MAG: ATP-dependent protease subunit HslV [Clostridia bacterium]|nr:ATP-dependent protease subunit HslV [Clostridia bacterium]
MLRGTTIVGVRRAGRVAVAGDGQVTLEHTVMKQGARKVRRLYKGAVLAGFAGGAADALTLLDRFERRLEEARGAIVQAAVELAREWRSDRVLRQLQALLLVADREHLLLVSGSGDVLEPDDDAVAIGSGGGYALAAARALLKHTELPAEAIAEEALRIAAGICVFTNDRITVEVLE